jgi:hypothetical protein
LLRQLAGIDGAAGQEPLALVAAAGGALEQQDAAVGPLGVDGGADAEEGGLRQP